MGPSLLLDRAFVTDLFLLISKGTVEGNGLTFGKLFARYELVLYESAGASAIEKALTGNSELQGKLTALPHWQSLTVEGDEERLIQQTIEVAKSDLMIGNALQQFQLEKGGPARDVGETLGYAVHLLLLARQHQAELLIWPPRAAIFEKLFDAAGFKGESRMDEEGFTTITVRGVRFPYLPASEQSKGSFKYTIVVPPKRSSIASQSSRMPLVLSLHGIRTRGVWQKNLTKDLGEAGFRHAPLDYGFSRVVRLLWPRSRRTQIDWFRDIYTQETEGEDSAPSIVAHSFGTYLVAEALRIYPEIKFESIILCGSIVRTDFPWVELIRRGCVKRLLNEYGRRDYWVRLASWVINDAGPSGAVGFEEELPDKIFQREHQDWRHSDYFYQLNYRGTWLPFLSNTCPDVNPMEPVGYKSKMNWRFRLVLTLVLVLLLILMGKVFAA